MQSILLPRYHPLDIFSFAREQQAAGTRVVLIIVQSVSGASVRPVGTPMVVNEAGLYAGYVSNGCVDADIARHALQALETSEVRRVQYGPDSPYLDIRLPCGGGVSVVIIPQPEPAVVSEICARLGARQSVSLSVNAGLKLGGDLAYAPPLRVIAAGRGENLLMFSRAAASLGIECEAYSPDGDDVKALLALGISGHYLDYGVAPDWQIDARTALLTLFHDHDYELPILMSALQSGGFYIGAMGSRATHQKRIAALSEMDGGLDLTRLRGPIGLVPSMRDAGRLAVSVLAAIIAAEGAPF